MPFLTIRHVTTYRYKQLVAFGEHRMMLRPREGHYQRVIDAKLIITPEPSDLRWIHDVFGNSVAIAQFDRRARELSFESIVHLDHRPLNELDFQFEPHAETYPFSYSFEEIPDLARSIERHYPDPDHAVDRWARQFLSRNGPTGTMDLLTDMTHAIKRTLTYVRRHERGVQEPARTLKLGSGTCRDFALLMMEAARSLGTFMVLDHIARARQMGLPYVYLGYWVRGSRKMDYKSRFLPQERLTPDGWARVK